MHNLLFEMQVPLHFNKPGGKNFSKEHYWIALTVKHSFIFIYFSCYLDLNEQGKLIEIIFLTSAKMCYFVC